MPLCLEDGMEGAWSKKWSNWSAFFPFLGLSTRYSVNNLNWSCRRYKDCIGEFLVCIFVGVLIDSL